MRFYRSLANSCQGGQTPLEAVELLAPGSKPMAEVAERLREGLSFGEAMRRRPDYFPGWEAEIVAASDAAGRLHHGFRVLSNILEERRAFWMSLLPELRHTFVLIHIAPVILFADSLWKLNVSGFAVSAGLFLMMFYMPAALIFILWHSWLKDSPLRRRLPLAASLAKAQFCFYLSSMMRAGVPLSRAMETSSAASGLKPSMPLTMITTSAEALKGVVSVLQRVEVFSHDELGKLQIAELSGKVDEELDNIFKQSQLKWQSFARGIVVLIPPISYLVLLVALTVRVVSFWWGYYSNINSLITL